MDLKEIYETLLKYFGEQYWWPGETRFEIIVGAILTQQTSWRNVEKAIQNLKKENMLNEVSLHKAAVKKIEKTIKPSGFYKIKTKRLKNFLNFMFKKYDGNLGKFFNLPKEQLRKELLSINGVGKETADSMILYAAEKPIFVVDAYTHRIFNRIGIINWNNYEKTRIFFEEKLEKSIEVFKEFHALIVQLGKNICKPKPKCNICPLNRRCKYAISINNSTEG